MSFIKMNCNFYHTWSFVSTVYLLEEYLYAAMHCIKMSIDNLLNIFSFILKKNYNLSNFVFINKIKQTEVGIFN